MIQDEATFTVNCKNTINLIHHGYEFRKQRIKRDGTTYWYCQIQRDLKCKAKAYTMKIGTKYQVQIMGKHLHAPKDAT